MGLTLKRVGTRRTYLSMNASADWPIRIFYGLLTLYQGLSGLFVPSSIFYQALQMYGGSVLIITCLIGAGSLLAIDGLMAMIRYCTSLSCRRIQPAMAIFSRRRPLLFLPPVFCYYGTIIIVNRHIEEGLVTVISYYVMLALAGMMFCIRDGVISQKVCRGIHV